MQQIQFLIDQNYKNRKTNEFRRLFHGRGNNYKGYEDITIDLIEDVVLLTIFKPIVYEDELLKYLQKRFVQNTIVVQKRYEKQSQVIQGSITKQLYAIENGMRFSLNLTNNQNIGFFADMIQGRSFLRKISRNKNILNLFSYTCSLSVAAGFKANQVVNVDMSKSALSIGRTNHQINQIDTKKIKFLPYNILKSWSRIKKFSPYDVVVIDPPSFQKRSFDLKKDYNKIIKRLDELCNNKAIVIACVNDPFSGEEFIKSIFNEYASSFHFVRRIKNHKDFPSANDQKDLKVMVFKNY